MTDLRQAHDAVREIAAAALGHDPGPMTATESSSHRVYVGSDVVVKIIEADGHARLNREIALAPHLPAGLAAPLLSSGLHRLGTYDVRYACYTRMPGATPGMGMPGMDGVTARALAEDAVQRLDRLHSWIPAAPIDQILREPLDHGGFTSQAALVSEVEDLAALDRHKTIPRRLIDGLTAIAERAPQKTQAIVPVHADCHWDNWLVHDLRVTALLDFEWARFGEPADDWFFLARFSGPHTQTVLDVISQKTMTPLETLRAECEIREATYLASDLCIALKHPDSSSRMAAERLHALEELIGERYWWRHTR
ncbi:phosphotransferase family protein [Streptomyces sp. NPDC059385]|uniref:phosphotransferase family protein n=1 Tax=Streptomyces sp. NPDC059385 TaxID=3346817 RepID=UPI0036B48B24